MENSRITQMTVDLLAKKKITPPRLTRQEDLDHHWKSIYQTITKIYQDNLTELIDEDMSRLIDSLYEKITNHIHRAIHPPVSVGSSIMLLSNQPLRVKNIYPIYETDGDAQDEGDAQDDPGDKSEEYEYEEETYEST